MIPIDYEVCGICNIDAKTYIHANHYSHGSHGGPSPCYGLYQGEGGLFGERKLLGVAMFATPCSENVRASVFGEKYVDCVTELHRLHLLDITPRNSESWMISRILRQLHIDRPDIRAVVSFADPTEGHLGVIYQATNAIYYGVSGKSRFWMDTEGRLRHPRQNGVNIAGEELGWKPVMREGKHRYVWLLGDKRMRRDSLRLLKVNQQSYPIMASNFS